MNGFVTMAIALGPFVSGVLAVGLARLLWVHGKVLPPLRTGSRTRRSERDLDRATGILQADALAFMLGLAGYLLMLACVRAAW